MALRVYIVPRIGDGVSPQTAFRPAYMPSGIVSTTIIYGNEPVYLVGADVTPAQHTTIAANTPITVVPEDLATVIANATVRDTIDAALESWGIPGHWVTVGQTYGNVVRGVASIFLFAQRLRARSDGRILPPGVTLSTTMGQLTQGQRDALNDAVLSMGWNTTGITLATTVRQFVRYVADQRTAAITIAGTNV